MSLLTVGSVAFDAIETPFGKTDRIIGGAGTYIALAASFYEKNQQICAVVGDDFRKKCWIPCKIEMLIWKDFKSKKGRNHFSGLENITTT